MIRKFLIPLFIVALMVSGCVGTPAQEVRYSDTDHQDENYIVFKASPTNPDTGVFTIVSTRFNAGGTYTETSEAYTLKYSEYNAGYTLKKVKGGIVIGDGLTWYK